MKANDTQVDGSHYKDMGDFQPWDVLQSWLTPEEYRGYQKGVIIAYMARERAKGGDADLKKAAHHLQKLLEVVGTAPVVAAPVADDGWIEWHGGIRPVLSTDYVEVKFRSGCTQFGYANSRYWSHVSAGGDMKSDIIAYRLSKKAQRDDARYVLNIPEGVAQVSSDPTAAINGS